VSHDPPCPAAMTEEHRLPAETAADHVHAWEDPEPTQGTIVCEYSYELPPPAFDFEHDAQKRVVCVSSSDGQVGVFRDRPIRYLVVRPHPKTGELVPVTRRGEPVCLYLCREEEPRS
jgi:hypothetical protein